MVRLVLRLIAIPFMLLAAFASPALAQSDNVTISETSETYTLSNGLVTAVVSKRSSDLLSLTYKGKETLSADSGGHSAAYWSHDTTGGKDLIPRISIDPKTNNGERAEVSIKGVSGGVKMGHGPGTATDGDIQLDIDIRWALGRGDKGVYTYTAFDHRPEYGPGTMAEARIAVELTKDFDMIHVDDARSGKYPAVPNAGIDKYTYVALQAVERAYGWTSSENKRGWFLLNPSAEYLSGGPTKVEFLAHGNPTVLNYWKSSHYYGANVTVAKGESWQKVIGPFMFYVNEGADHAAMIADAKKQLKAEEKKWPYTWVDVAGYSKPAERSTVSGTLALDDKLSLGAKTKLPGRLTIGLSRAPYDVVNAAGVKRTLDWQNDGKFYEFWATSDDPDGQFEIPNVAPGKYTLYAFADGVLGEFVLPNVEVPEVKPNKFGDMPKSLVLLGKQTWTPKRFGKQLWEVGTANRSAAEFALGNRYFEPAIQLEYNKLFPQDVNFRPGKSDAGKDWFFAQMPRAEDMSKAEIRAFSGLVGNGRATPFNVIFDMDKAGKGAAMLRMAITTTATPVLNVKVNGKAAGQLKLSPIDNSMARHQIYGRWFEAGLSFDAALLKKGENTVTLEVPAGPLNNGVTYDYVRLELDEAATPQGQWPAPKPAPAIANVTVPPPTKLAALEIRRLSMMCVSGCRRRR